MKKTVLAAALLGAVLSSSAFAQQATEGSWMVRARAVHLESSNGDTTPLGLSANNKWLPEVDFTYFYNKNLAVELILTIPQKHTLYSNGGAIGTFKHLPPHPDRAIPLYRSGQGQALCGRWCQLHPPVQCELHTGCGCCPEPLRG